MNFSVFDEIAMIAQGKTWIHQRNPRAKIFAAAAFVVTLTSYHRTDVSAILPLALFLVWWASTGFISFRWLLRRILFPVLMLAIFGSANMWLERTVEFKVFSVPVTTGFLSWSSLVLRALFSLSIILLLTATTGISSLAEGLKRIGIPRSFITTLMLLYRYIFVLTDESKRMNRARLSRSFGKRGFELSVGAKLLGQFLVRSLARAERIHAAMLARGFGEGQFSCSSSCWNRSDTIFVLASLLFFLFVRFLQPSLLVNLFWQRGI